MRPTIGRIVLYMLTAEDAEQINRRRTSGPAIARRMAANTPGVTHWPSGAQAHIGNPVKGGGIYPMIVTKVETDGINGQVFLDGNDTLWVELVAEGPGPGTWIWPPLFGGYWEVKAR